MYVCTNKRIQQKQIQQKVLTLLYLALGKWATRNPQKPPTHNPFFDTFLTTLPPIIPHKNATHFLVTHAHSLGV